MTGPTQDSPDDIARLAAENEALKAELDTLSEARTAKKRASRLRMRRIGTVILVILTSLCVAAATVGVWTKRTLASTDRYVALVGPLASDPEVTGPLGTRLTEEVFVALDVEGRVREALASIPNAPAAIGFIAGPITQGAKDLIEARVQEFLNSPAFAELWIRVNTVAHDKLAALLNGDYDQLPNVAIDGGEVQLNLVSLVAEVIRRLGQEGADLLGIDVTIPEIPADLDVTPAVQMLSSALGVSLPPDFGQVTILSADQLSGYQDAVRGMKRLVVALFILSLLLIAATVALAPDRRRAVIWLGAGITVALFLGGVFLRRIRTDVVDSIGGPGARAAADDVFGRVIAGLRHAGMLVLAVALIAAVVAYLMGRPPWFQRTVATTKRVTARRPGGSELEVWLAAHAEPVRIGGVALGAVLLFLTGIDWIPVAIVAVLVGLLLWEVSIAVQRARGGGPVSPEATV
jgi:hypothetical protein